MHIFNLNLSLHSNIAKEQTLAINYYEKINLFLIIPTYNRIFKLSER